VLCRCVWAISPGAGHGNFLLGGAATAELPRVEVVDALRNLGVFSHDLEVYERAAVRWLGRFCLKAPDAPA
jgi:hypothetical protein